MNAAESTRPLVTLIAGVARNGVIGRDNQLLWRLPEDLAFFRRQTQGHPVLMGRRTWDSLPPRFRPLPGRRNLVLTRQPGFQAEGAEVLSDLAQVWPLLAGMPQLFVIGGEQVYRETLPLADRLLLTEVDQDFEGDAHFPTWPREEFTEVAREWHQAAAPNDFRFAFVTYERRASGA